MNRVLVGLLASQLIALTALAQDAQQLVDDGRLLVRAYTEPDGNVYLGQQTRFFIEVLTDSWFTTSPRSPELRVEGAVVLEPERFSSNITRRVGGGTLSGIRRGYLVYPQRSGQLTIPPLDISFGIAVDGNPSRLMTLRTDSIGLQVQMPPGGEARLPFISTPKLEADQNISSSRDELRVGDSITRTVTLSAADSQALLLPVIRFAPFDGASVYPDPAQLSNKANRGRYSGARIDSATYILERPGDYELPEITLNWWDSTAERFRTVSLPAAEFSVSPDPAAVMGNASTEPLQSADRPNLLRSLLHWLKVNIRNIVVICIAGIFVLMLSRRLWLSLLQGLMRRRKRKLNSEPHVFGSLERACKYYELREIRIALHTWAATVGISPAVLYATLKSDAVDADCRQEWERLNRVFYRDDHEYKPDRQLMVRWCRQLRACLREPRDSAEQAVTDPYAGSLNPLL